MKVVIIIVTFNGVDYIEKCINSLRTKTTFEKKIIVIDNASSDGTVNLVKTNFPEVTVYEAANNLGFGQANNIGFKLALDWNADYFFLLNQDAWVEGNCIETLVELSINNSDFGIISPIHLNGTKTGFDHGFINHLSRTGEANEILFNNFTTDLKKAYPVSFVNAAAWLISRPCLEKVGGFAPLFFHYGEDDNYIHRIKYHRFKMCIAGAAFICHDRLPKPKMKNDFARQVRRYCLQVTNINNDFNQIKKASSSEWRKSIVRNLTLFRWRLLVNVIRLILFAKANEDRIKQTRAETQKGGLIYL